MRSPYAVTQLLPHRTLAILLLSVVAVAGPHLMRLPPWIGAGLVLCALWRYLAGTRGWHLPSRWLLLPATGITVAAVYLVYGTLLGLDAGVAVLTAMLGLKLLELRHRRDTVVALYLSFFLLTTHLFYSTSLLALAFMFAAVWILLTLLITVTRPTPGASPLEHGVLAGSLVLQALPVMALLFVLFPRLPGPLWSMPELQSQGVTGIGDTMTPGNISNLSQSDAVAFRVEFENQVPHTRDLYWRGPVLADYDGRTWRSSDRIRRTQPAVANTARRVRYTVTLEPTGDQHLFALDLPVRVDTSAFLDSAYQLRRLTPIRDRLRYEARSALDYSLQPDLPPSMLTPYTELPEGAHPATRELAERWRADAPDARAFIQRVLNHFREEPFTYTLRPPLLRGDTVDTFLFDTRRGFCEHFAGAFAVMMRAGGIPARVVLGYQGGEINPSGGYLIVRQSEAHAWVELFLPGEGWRRFDPTAWVAPERIEDSLASAIDDTDTLPGLASRTPGTFRTLALQWDALNAYWDRWVLGYGPDMQQRLMNRLGLRSWQSMITALALAMVVFTALVALLVLRRNRPPHPDPAARAWGRFCARLASAGITRHSHEGPLDFAARAARARPDLADAIDRVTRLYIVARYSEVQREQDALAALRRSVADFRP